MRKWIQRVAALMLVLCVLPLQSEASMDTASTIGNNHIVSGTVGAWTTIVGSNSVTTENFYDYYKFTLDQMNTAVVSTSATSAIAQNLRVAILNVNGSTITSSYGPGTISQTLEPGTYYIRVSYTSSSNAVKYTLKLTYCAHKNTTKVVTEPTCTTGGYTTYTCSDCGKTWEDNRTSAAHKFKFSYYSKEPDCTSRGIGQYICSACGEKEGRFEESLGHSVSGWTATKEPTCTQPGSESGPCTRCGETQTREIEMLGHNYSAWKTTKAATCTEAGSRSKTCSRCADAVTETIAALGHCLVKDPQVGATCLPGRTEGEHCNRCGLVTVEQEQISPAYEHYYSEDTDATCVSCGTYRDIVSTIPGATMGTAEEASLGQTLQKEWNSENYNTSYLIKFTLPQQGLLLMDMEGIPDFRDNTRGYDATLQILDAGGSLCWAQYGDYSTGLGSQFYVGLKAGTYYLHIGFHDIWEWSYGDVTTSINLAFQADDGVETEANNRFDTADPVIFGKSYKGSADYTFNAEGRLDYFRIPTDPQHTYRLYLENYEELTQNDVMFSATLIDEFDSWNHMYGSRIKQDGEGQYYCEFQAGRSRNWYLQIDNLMPVQLHYSFRVVPVHEYDSYVTAPTCTEQGYTTHSCIYCDYAYKDTYTGPHNLGFSSMQVPSNTCIRPTKIFDPYCKDCGETFGEMIEIPASGHSYGEWAMVRKATCALEGLRRRTCGCCSAAEEEAIPCLPHMEIVLPAVEATCAATGLTEGLGCSVCKKVLTAQQTVPTNDNHSYSGSICKLCGHDIGPITETARWDFDEATGTLTISGTGPMADYAKAENIPWYDLREEITAVNISSGITGIGDANFHGCKKLTNVSIPGSVTRIGESAFNDCTALAQITLPDTITHIEKYAFSMCYGLKKITLPAGLTSVEEKLFAFCDSLAAVTIPSGVTSIGNEAFWYCDALREIRFLGDAPKFANSSLRDVVGTVYYPLGNETWTDSVRQNYYGRVTWKAMDKDGHVPVVMPYKAATCTASGLTEGSKCEKCGKILFAQSTIPANGHKLSAPVVYKAPTCTAEGIMHETCTVCGHIRKTTILSPGHKYQSVVTDPTCSDAGYTTHTCSACGNSYQDTPLPAKGHSFGDWTTTKEPTCTEPGAQRRDCVNCDAYEDGVLEAPGHSMKPGWVVIKEATCTEDGEYRQYCKNCDHYDAKVISAKNHSYSRTEVTEPTCTDGGYTTHICIYCSDSYTDTETAPAGHSMGDWVDEQAATCTAEGTQRSDCANCDHYETRKTDKLSHSYEEVVTPPTCTAGGYTTHTCSACGDSYTNSETPVADHSYGDWVTIKEGTCTDTGTRECSCSICGDTKSESIPASHNMVDGVCQKCGQSTGSCGKNACWSFDAQTGTLTISGSGAMTDYAAANDLPWYSLRDGIQTVIVSEGITHIADRAFVAHKSLIRAELPDTLQSIGESAFYNCAALPELVIPEGVTEIPESAFYQCARLVSISIPESVTHIGNWAFMYCGHLEEVTIPSGVTSISYSQFNGCSALTEIRIPEGVTTIDNYAFQNCFALKNVHLPETLESIGLSAFQNCTALTSVRVPASVTTIKGSAFSGCSSLKKVAFAGSAPVITSTAFSSVTADAYYPGSDTSWKYEQGNYGGTLSWKAHCTSHTLVTDPGVAATCTVPGLTEGKHCSVCLFVQKAQNTIPVAEHSYGSWKTVTAGSCQTEGVQQRTCGACGDTQTQKIPASGHSYRYVIVEPTCTASGYTIHTCASCGDSYQDQPVPVIDHQAETWWHSDSSVHWQQCRFCGVEMNRADHVPGDPATENTSQKCTDCGHVLRPPMGLDWFFGKEGGFLPSGYFAEIMERYGS